jgi:phosphoribosylanthranilate isomerase
MMATMIKSIMHIKICGLTRVADAVAAEEAGANAIGLNFVPNTKRFITIGQAKAISQAVSPLLARVGVFRNAPLTEVLQTANAVGLSAIQVHGQESWPLIAALAQYYPVVVARHSDHLGVDLSDGLSNGQAWPNHLNLLPLIDAAVPGSGQAFDWAAFAASPGYRALQGRRWLLAGGLTPANVAAALAALRPWGVDVSSGVESAPGHKDPALMQAFVSAAKGG